MGSNKFNRMTIPVSKIDLDLRNPRFGRASSQIDAIAKIIELNRLSNGNKVVNLAKHIILYGFNPADLIILIADGNGRYVDKEGNRRICATKLLRKPSLLPASFPECKKFEGLAKTIKRKNIQIEEPQCVVFENEAEADFWVDVMHTGDNDGYGRIKWGSKEKENHKALMRGKKSNILQLCDFIEFSDATSPEMKNAFRNMSHTNLERLLSSEEIRRRFGIKFSNDGIYLIAPEQEVINAFEQVCYDFVSNPDSNARKKVADIYTKEKCQKYVDSISQKLPATVVSPQKVEIGIPDEDKNDRKSFHPQKSKDSFKIRKGMLPKGLTPSWATEKFAQVIKELETLDYRNYPLAAAVLFRIFFETTLSMYMIKSGHIEQLKKDAIDVMHQKHLKKYNTEDGFVPEKCLNMHIWPQLNDMLSYVEKSNILSSNPNAVRAFSEFIRKNGSSIIHIDSLNFYTHNASSSIPDAATLFQYWQELEGAFQILLNIPTPAKEGN